MRDAKKLDWEAFRYMPDSAEGGAARPWLASCGEKLGRSPLPREWRPAGNVQKMRREGLC